MYQWWYAVSWTRKRVPQSERIYFFSGILMYMYLGCDIKFWLCMRMFVFAMFIIRCTEPNPTYSEIAAAVT